MILSSIVIVADGRHVNYYTFAFISFDFIENLSSFEPLQVFHFHLYHIINIWMLLEFPEYINLSEILQFPPTSKFSASWVTLISHVSSQIASHGPNHPPIKMLHLAQEKCFNVCCNGGPPTPCMTHHSQFLCYVLGILSWSRPFSFFPLPAMGAEGIVCYIRPCVYIDLAKILQIGASNRR